MGVVSVTADNFSPSLGSRSDAFGNPVGKALPGWAGCQRLPDIELAGRTCRVAPYDRHFAGDIYSACAEDDGRLFTYLSSEPYSSVEDVDRTLRDGMDSKGLQTFAICSDQRALGHASFMRYDLVNGCVEVGGVTFPAVLQRTVMATEAMYLMMKHAFDHGYRRYEWKCDQLNAPSKRAAERLGFTFEGVFRNAVVTKGRRRDTAWFSVIVEEWPQVRARLETWLDPANFDSAGRQRTALSTISL